MLLNDEGIKPDFIVLLDRPDELVREFSMGRCTDSTTGVIYHPKVRVKIFAVCFFSSLLEKNASGL